MQVGGLRLGTLQQSEHRVVSDAEIAALWEAAGGAQRFFDRQVERALAAQSQLQTMAQATNSRQFLLQLQNLVDRVDTDLKVALRELEQAKAVLLQATHQRMKMETMQEKDLHAVQQWERQRDQKDMDSLGLTLYNLKA